MVFDIHDWLIVIDYLQSSQSQFCHFSKHFFVIVVNLFYFTENFASVHLVDFVGQFVGSNVGLQSQLKLSNDILVYDNFERYVVTSEMGIGLSNLLSISMILYF